MPHLDREFDYLVPVALDDRAVPGSRVSVRFGGRAMTGWLVSREQEPATGAQKSYLHTLANQAGEDVPDDISKADASIKIDELQEETGRGK